MITRRIIPTAQAGARAFSSTLRAQKTLTESAKDTAQDINIKVGKTLAAGLETAEGAVQATKETIVGGSKEAAKKAEQTAEVGKRKANETAEVGKQKANETSAHARGKTEELRQKGQKELGS